MAATAMTSVKTIELELSKEQPGKLSLNSVLSPEIKSIHN
jgi:hypothetical protein